MIFTVLFQYIWQLDPLDMSTHHLFSTWSISMDPQPMCDSHILHYLQHALQTHTEESSIVPPNKINAPENIIFYRITPYSIHLCLEIHCLSLIITRSECRNILLNIIMRESSLCALQQIIKQLSHLLKSTWGLVFNTALVSDPQVIRMNTRKTSIQ